MLRTPKTFADLATAPITAGYSLRQVAGTATSITPPPSPRQGPQGFR